MNQFSTILLDPPWPEPGGGGRGPQRHYGLLKLDDIVDLVKASPVWRPADRCHLWIWSPRKIANCIHVIEQLGFQQQSFVMWGKRGNAGLGRYVRYKGELLLLATRGKAMIPEKAPENLLWTEVVGEVPMIEAARVVDTKNKPIHSRKPDDFHSLIEQVSPGPYLEMFARRRRPGWECWGDEVDGPLNK